MSADDFATELTEIAENENFPPVVRAEAVVELMDVELNILDGRFNIDRLAVARIHGLGFDNSHRPIRERGE